MPGVNKDGSSQGGYGYDIGGKTEKIKVEEPAASTDDEQTTNDEFPSGGFQGGSLGRLDKLNTDRFYERPPQKEVDKVYAKTGYEATGAFDKAGNVKDGPKSDVQFLEKDGSWAPAEGRGNAGNITKMTSATPRTITK